MFKWTNIYINQKIIKKSIFCVDKFFFCTKQQAESLVPKIEKQKLILPGLTLQILKYLEKNQQIYKRLLDEANELAQEAASSDLLKVELMRINKQIHEFSKENYYHDEVVDCIGELLSNMTLYNEALEIDDKDIANQAESDIDSLKKKLEGLKDEIIDFLIPENVTVNLKII
jgi:hypothetical protein